MENKNIYLNEVLKQVPRLLGLMNRSPLSKTYGCFDRQYWQYNITDTPSARSQEAVLTLALLYNIKRTPYYKSKTLFEWINAGINFWTQIQEKNGSFNEWYPKENSFVATAFSTYSISETLILLKDKLRLNASTLKSIKKAADFLIRKSEHRVQNQEAGAILALHNTYLLTKDKKYKDAAEKKTKEMRMRQTKESWFYEYGGADIGYLSLLIDYIAKYYLKSKNKEAFYILKKSISFISYFIHPNMTNGGEYGSRNTEYLIPSGFEMVAKLDDNAAAISQHIRRSIKKRTSISPSSLDDRYLTYICYNWLQAYLASTKLKKVKARYNKNFSKDFKLAKIFVLSDKRSYFIISYGKGGAFKFFDKKTNNCIYDAGILVKTKDNLTSNHLTDKNKVVIHKNGVQIKGLMSKIIDKKTTSFSVVALRSFQHTIGKSEKIGQFLKEKLRDNLITKEELSDVHFVRKIQFKNKKIEDTVIGNNIRYIIVGSKHSYIYTPSSKYFQISELKNAPLFIDNIDKSKKIKVIREFGDSTKVKINKEYTK